MSDIIYESILLEHESPDSLNVCVNFIYPICYDSDCSKCIESKYNTEELWP